MKNLNDEIIKTSGLTKYYGQFAGVLDLDLSVRQGEIYGFLGPNGAGKTTLIRLLLGLVKPSSGEIWILGKKAAIFQTGLFNHIGYLPGDIGLYKDLSGNDYLHHFINLRTEKSNDADLRKMESLMKRFNIAFDKKISMYSKGMKQVIGIIQAFMHNPRLLILDEPTSGLDPMMQELFYDLILEEKKAGRTIFLSSHILSEVERICDRIGIIKNGKLINVEELGKQRSNIAKKVSIIPQKGLLQSFEILRKLAGVKDIAIKNDKIEFLYNGDIQRLTERIVNIKIKDMVCEPTTLEDLFYKYYKE